MQHAEIVARLPGLNEYTRANRNNKYGGAKMKKEAEETCAVFLHSLKPVEGKVAIRFVWTEKALRRDLDNIAFAKKFILDTMTRLGILQDDSPKYVVGFRDELRKGDVYKVDIYIEEVV